MPIKLNRMNPVFLAYLKLIRPANIPTAAADILAGIAIAGITMDTDYITVEGLRLFPMDWYLSLASVCMYAGGVVLNDVFDLKIDRIERPERPIPKGVISQKSAAIFGSVLLLIGIALAFAVNNLSGNVAIILVLAILIYDSFSKKYRLLGPLNMGICRGLNLILGMSIIGHIYSYWYALIPLAYIFAVTLVSRGEVHAGNRKQIIWAGILYAGVIFAVVSVVPGKPEVLVRVIPFLLLFIVLIYRPLLIAYRQNTAENIRKAVVAGVLSIIALDATIASGFSGWGYGILVILLLPLCYVLSRIFDVT